MTPDVQAAIATVAYSRQTHVEWASYLRQNPSREPGAVGDAEYHERAVAEYDNVLAVLRCVHLPLLASAKRPVPVRVVYEGEDPEMDAFWHSHMAADQRDREAEQRTRYESHQWNPTNEDQECIVCGVTWVDCDDECPGPTSPPPPDWCYCHDERHPACRGRCAGLDEAL